MPLRNLRQRSFLDLHAETLVGGDPGTLQGLLVRYRSAVLPRWLTSAWTRGRGKRGRPAWPVESLLALLLLQWSESGASRVGSCNRAQTDLLWRYVIGVGVDDGTPTEKSLREIEAWLQEEHENSGTSRMAVWFAHIAQIALWSEVTRGRPIPSWVMDSTPMWCFGAVLDTVRLLGDGIRRIGRTWARATKGSLAAVAREWELPLLTARSTKGWFRIDWADADARSDVISSLVADTMRVVELVHSKLEALPDSWRRKQLANLCELLLRVIEQDLEQDKGGRWRIARRVAEGRLVSLTDPEARHGRKTQSERFWGYKIHVLGDAVSGIVAALLVTPGSSHDAEPGHALVAKVRQMRIDLGRVLADTAYGGAESRTKLKALGIELVAPPPAPSATGEKQSKNEFEIDFERMRATCPNGVETDQVERTRGKVENLAFRWPIEACARCPLQAKCLRSPIPADYATKKARGRPRRTGKRLVLDPFERERREARAWWADPKTRELYRRRSPGERLHTELLRHGARQARSRGLAAAQLQVHLIGLVVNLEVLARNVAAIEAAAMPKATTTASRLRSTPPARRTRRRLRPQLRLQLPRARP